MVGPGARTDGQVIWTDDQVTGTDGQVTMIDRLVTRTAEQGTRTDGQVTGTDGQDTRTDGQVTGTDGQGTRKDKQGAGTDGQVTRTEGPVIRIYDRRQGKTGNVKGSRKLTYSLYVMVTFSLVTVRASFEVPGMDRSVYFMSGDLLLGGLFRVHAQSTSQICGSKIQSQKQFQYHEAMVYAVSMVNDNQDVLPNTTLGFAILDDCTRDQAAMARALSWVPPADCCSCTAVSSAPYYPVVGVVSGSNSQNTLTAAGFLNLFGLPMVGAVSTSELLSDKLRYKHFLRVVPSDNFQAQVIIDILLHYNWSYISTINSPGGYGEVGIKAVRNLAERNGICVAYSREVNRTRGEPEYEYIVRNLVRYRSARVVVMFVSGSDGRGVIRAAHESGMRNDFIWITSDGVGAANDLAGIEETGAGGFHVQLFSTPSQAFRRYFEAINPVSSTNPWIGELWEASFNCHPPACPGNLTMADVPGYSPYDKAALFQDSVKTFAYALHAFIMDHCPAMFGRRTELRECVKPWLLQPYLYNVSFDGSYGRVRFDERGDADGVYIIEQLQQVSVGRYVTVAVGRWNKFTRQLSLTGEMYWNVKENGSMNGDVKGRQSMKGREQSVNGSAVPESVCSKPCQSGQFYIQLEVKCCWECKQCRSNEITVSNASSCEECPLYTWPHPVTVASCQSIPPYHLSWGEVLPAVCLVLALLGLAMSLVSLIVYIVHRDSKLIKATSRELSLIALAGNTLSYITAIFVIMKPDLIPCYVGRLGFNISICVVYASLLTKTNRIYRIFNSAKKGTQKPLLTSNRSQVGIVCCLILLQVVISAVTTVLAPPAVRVRMPVRSEKYTELLCDLPMTGFIPSLAFNLLLILSCSFYAFKARKLPDNFNESRFIFFTVCTTIFLWLAFLSTYFTAFYAPQKALLLTTMLLMNASIILLCMYIPKMYALYYVDEGSVTGQTMASIAGTNTVQPTTTTTSDSKK